MVFRGEKLLDMQAELIHKIRYTIIDSLGIRYKTSQLIKILTRDQNQETNLNEVEESTVQNGL